MPTVFKVDDDDYQGKTDYQGNREVYEMPKDHRPPPPASSFPVKKVALALIAVGIVIVLVATAMSIYHQSGSLL
jgi:hypothetical protein